MAGNAKQKHHYHFQHILEQVWADLVNGLSNHEIRQKLQNDLYDEPTSHFKKSWHYKIIAEAYKELSMELAENRDKQRVLFYNRLLALYNDSVEHNDRQVALGTLKEFAKFANLYEDVQKLEVKGNLTIDFGFDED